MPIRDELAKI